MPSAPPAEVAPGTLGAVIVAAGRGTRFGQPTNKVWAPLLGRPVLWYSLAAFRATPLTGPIVLVVGADDLPLVRGPLAGLLDQWAVTAVVVGGPQRFDSMAAGLAAVPPEARLVAVHDGARPLVRPQTITAVAHAAAQIGAAIAAETAVATVKLAAEDTAPQTTISPSRPTLPMIATTIARQRVWLAQTPQIAVRTLLERAVADHIARGERAAPVTDEAELLERAAVRVGLVASGYANLKITTPEDLLMAEMLLQHGGGTPLPPL